MSMNQSVGKPLLLADPANETVRFASSLPPPLQDGTYTLTVSQSVSAQLPGAQSPMPVDPQPQNATLTFTVTGPRFVLPAGTVLNQFPQSQSTDDYAGVLPFVTLSSPSLPWTVDVGTAGASFLFVLLIAESDGIEAPVSATTVAAFTAGNGGGSGPLLPSLTPLADDTTAMTVIDLPGSVFNGVMPCLADLPYLAHVREIANTAAGGGTVNQTIATVLANRTVGSGPCTAYLVSLEGWQGSLPDTTGAGTIAATATARMAVLSQWSFNALPGSASFDAVAMRLSSAPFAIPGSGTTGTIAQALGLGYTAAMHRTRRGDTTASWYRGPLVPCGFAEEAAIAALSGTCADAWLRYDPTTGMFDTSYAAAWQLGRQLALANQTVTLAQTQAAATARRAAALAGHQASVTGLLGISPPPQGVSLSQHTLTTALQLFAGRAKVAAPAAPPTAAATPTAVTQPQALSDFVAALQTLQTVPWAYLVPHPAMLPPESLRFFRIDPNWMQALLAGGLSLGSGTVPAPPTPAVSGFLLNSQLINTHPGLRMVAANAGGQTLPPLRFETLSNQTIIALYADVVATVTLRPPTEQLTFGLTAVGPDGTPSAMLRYFTDCQGNAAGTPITSGTGPNPPPVSVPAPLRSVLPGVVQLNALFGAVSKALPSDLTASFDAGDLPLQLMLDQANVIFTVS